MADFTVEGIIDVDASRGIREVKRFKKELKGLMADLEAVDKLIEDLDGSKIRIDVDVDQDKLSEVRRDIESLRDADVEVDVDINTDEDALAELTRQVEILEDSTGDIEIGVDVDGDDIVRELAEINREIDALTETIEIETELAGVAGVLADARRLRKQVDAALGEADVDVGIDRSFLDKFSESVAGASGGLSGGGGLIALIALLLTTLGPLAGVATAVGAGLLGGFTTAGVGVGAFAAFAIPTIKEVSEAVKLLNTDTSKLSGDQLTEYNEALREMKAENPGIWEAAQAFTKLKENYMSYVEQLKPDVIDIFANSLKSLNTLVGYAGPIALEMGDAFVKMSEDINSGLKGEEWRNFFKYVEENAGQFTTQWGQFFGNLLTGIGNLVVALDPLTKWFMDGLVRMTENFREWAKTVGDSEGFERFVAFVQENGPLVGDLIGNIVDAIINLAVNLAPVGVKVIEVVNSMLEWYNQLSETNPALAEFVTQAGLLLVALTPLIGPLGSVLSVVMPLAGALGAVGATAGIILGVVGAIAGLIAVLTLVNTESEEHKVLMDGLKSAWDAVVSVGETVWGVLKDIWEALQDSGAIGELQEAFGKLADAWSELAPILEPAAQLLGVVLVGALIALAYGIGAFADAVSVAMDVIGPIIDAIVAAFQWLYDILLGHSIIPDIVNGIVEWFTSLPGKVAGALAGLAGGVAAKFTAIKDYITNKLGAAKDALVNKFTSMVSSGKQKVSAIKDAVSQRFTSIKETITQKLEGAKQSLVSKFTTMAQNAQQKASSIKQSISTKFGEAKNAVSTKVQEMLTAARTKWSSIVSTAGEKFGQIKGKVTGAFSGAATWLYNAGKSIMDGLISGVESMIGSLTSAFNRITNMIPDVKGPPVKDRKLLEPAGKMIMGGLVKGFQKERTKLTSELKTITKIIDFNDRQLSGTVVKAPWAKNRGNTGGGVTDATDNLNKQKRWVMDIKDDITRMASRPLTQKQWDRFDDNQKIGYDAPVKGIMEPAGGGKGKGNGVVYNTYYIKVEVAPGGNLAEAGRQIVDAIKAYERAGGRKKRSNA